MEVKVPATLVNCELPKLVRSYDEYVLDKGVLDLADLVKREFMEDNGYPPKNPAGRIPGWDGDYLSAIDWKRRLKFKGLDFKTARFLSLDGELELNVLPVKVSVDLASSHYYSNKDGNQDENPICCLGSYIVPVVLDGHGNAVLLVATRPETAFLYPTRFDATGAALSKDFTGLGYVDEISSKLNSKFGITVDPKKVKSLGIIRDNVVNYLLPSGWTFISDADVSSDCKLRAVSVKEFEDFVRREAPIESWNYPAFVALCETVYRLGQEIKDTDLMSTGRRILAEQYTKLKTKPIQEKSVLQNLQIV